RPGVWKGVDMSRLLPRRLSHRSNGFNRPQRADVYRAEPLERRILLSQIVWVDQGSANNDSDDFNAAYGSNAAAARGCVLRAMQMWSQVIVDFNYADVDPPYDNTYYFSVHAADLGGGTRGSTTGIQDDDDDKPYQAEITMDDDS